MIYLLNQICIPIYKKSANLNVHLDDFKSLITQ